MKFLKLVCLLVLFTQAFAKSYIISPLPLPQQEVLNISTNKCSSSCLSSFFNNGEWFSFVAFFNHDTKDSDLRAKLATALNDLGIFDQLFMPIEQSGAQVRLALLMPKKTIGRYSASSINTILAYLMTRGGDFVFEAFDTGNESYESIKNTYEKIENAKYDFVIAILTANGANELSKLHINIPTFIPTVHKNDIKANTNNKNIFFGGIDYCAQVDLLLDIAGSKNIVSYNDNSAIGRKLGLMVKESNRVIYEEIIDSKSATTFIQQLSKHESKIAGNAIFFNTPANKTGLIASQLATAKKKPYRLLSTQINFNPSLLLLIQKEDRENLYIANIINNKNQNLVEYAWLLGGDLRYDWVNYATAVSVEQLLLNHSASRNRFFQESIKDNQIHYINRIYRSDAKRFYEQ